MSELLLSTVLIIASLCASSSTSTKIKPDGPINGFKATKAEFPYQVSFRKGGRHFCSGSILNEEWILTSALCVSVLPFVVVTGTNSLNSTGDSYEVETSISHEGFDQSFASHNDIALIKLKSFIVFKDDVQPVQLESENVGAHEDCVLSGWGAMSFEGKFSYDLVYNNLKTITQKECQETILLESPLIIQNQLCTITKPGDGECQGDLGGPLVRNVDNKKRLIGVLSWGMLCDITAPNVYTRVSSYVSWINANCNNCAKK